MKRCFFIACAISLLILSFGKRNDCTVGAQSTGEPELPRVILSTSYPATNGAVLNLPSGGDLQAVLNSAQLGDTIVLQEGGVYVGNFTLPAKTGSGWIVIRTSNLNGITAEGSRVSPSQAIAMPKIITPNAAPAFATSAGANHYRLVGIEIGVSQGVSTSYGIVTLGDTTSQTSLTSVPHDLVIDRCFIHGNATGDVSRGVALNSASTAIVDSYISSIHGIGFDTQAIAGWNGPGPFKILNNYLEAAGENFMLGGADPKITNLVPSDIEFRRNHCLKPLSWNPIDISYAGIHWSVKNLFELKNARRVIIDGNVFENCWVDGQTGFAVVFTPRNQEGTAPWSAVQDVTFTNNIARHAAAGVQFLGHDDNFPSQQEQRIKVQNNLFDDIGGARWGGNGRLFQIVDGTADVHIDHNTAFQTYNIITADGAAHPGFVYTNNIAPHNAYGVIGSGQSIGNGSLNFYFPGCRFMKNIIAGGPSGIYPSDNFFPTLNEIGFLDVQGGNYRLASTSPFKNAATDGRDIGADLDLIDAALGGQILPSPPTNQPPQVSISETSTSGLVPLLNTFTANASDSDGSISSYAWDFGDGGTSTLATVSHVYQVVGTFTARVTVTDNLSATATASVVIYVTAPPLPPGSEIVLYASEAPLRVGRWNVVTDTTAAGGGCMWNPDLAAPKIIDPVALPADYFEMTFYAVAGRPYRLWIRSKAQNDSPYNDSVFVQFSGSVDAGGAPVFRIGTSDATVMNLEDCLGCGLQGWGWQDNGWGVGVMGPLVYFSTTGPQTLRVQVREDGLSIDQIVLSPQAFLTSPPGSLKNDATVLSKTTGLSAPSVSAIMPNSGLTSGGTSVVISGSGFVPGASVTVGGLAATSVQVYSAISIGAVTCAHSSGAVDVVVKNPDGQSCSSVRGYTYMASNQPPTVTITASATSGIAPFAVKLIANASDSDGSINGYLWDFGDGQSSTVSSPSHIYQSAGIFMARVTVSDNSAATANASVTISVLRAPLAVTLLYPNSGETLQCGSAYNITWFVSGGSPTRQEIQLSVSGGSSWTVLATGLAPSVNSLVWLTPRQPSSASRIRVRAWDANGSVVEDVSDVSFSIVDKAKNRIGLR